MMPTEISKYNRLRQYIDSLRDSQRYFEGFLQKNLSLGHVYTGSGVNRICIQPDRTRRMYDWALVRVYDRLPEKNSLFRSNKVISLIHLAYIGIY
jgi:hypothetical protein